MVVELKHFARAYGLNVFSLVLNASIVFDFSEKETFFLFASLINEKLMNNRFFCPQAFKATAWLAEATFMYTVQ